MAALQVGLPAPPPRVERSPAVSSGGVRPQGILSVVLEATYGFETPRLVALTF